MYSAEKKSKKITTTVLRSMKKRKEKISMLTAYDATFARLIQEAGIETVLVGDSLGMVIQGNENTLPVTIEDIIYHTRAVKRGITTAHLVADMPFMSYQASVSDALKNSGRAIKEGGAESVKLEGGLEIVDKVTAIVSAGIPVMAHIGLKPQSVHQTGGYKIQGKTCTESERLVEEALAFERAGVYSLLLEGIAIETAEEITNAVGIPTIGIGSGPHCDGQVLVIYDLLGMNEKFSPKFLKKYENLSETIKNSTCRYIQDVKAGGFPSYENAYHRQLHVIATPSLPRGKQ